MQKNASTSATSSRAKQKMRKRTVVKKQCLLFKSKAIESIWQLFLSATTILRFFWTVFIIILNLAFIIILNLELCTEAHTKMAYTDEDTTCHYPFQRHTES